METVYWVSRGFRGRPPPKKPGSLYEGELDAAGNRHGYGMLKFHEEDKVYIGQFESGKQHGEGRLLLQDGCSMMGEWREGEFVSGSVRKYAMPDGSVYSGGWKDGQPSGDGFVEDKWISIDFIKTGPQLCLDIRNVCHGWNQTLANFYWPFQLEGKATGTTKDGKLHGLGDFSGRFKDHREKLVKCKGQFFQEKLHGMGHIEGNLCAHCARHHERRGCFAHNEVERWLTT